MKSSAILALLTAGVYWCLFSLISDAAAPGGSIYPSAVGTRWIYDAGVMELEERVTGIEEIAGERCARIETSVQGKVVAYEHLAFRPDGVYRVAIAGEQVVPPLCFLKYPAPLGTQWDVRSKIKGQEIAGHFVLGQAVVTIPSGQQQALSSRGTNFESEAGPLEFTYYFVPGIGKVKQVVSINGRAAELTLKEFHPPQAER